VWIERLLGEKLEGLASLPYRIYVPLDYMFQVVEEEREARRLGLEDKKHPCCGYG
jgi:hypothetical protein